jgi:hypothetical protein
VPGLNQPQLLRARPLLVPELHEFFQRPNSRRRSSPGCKRAPGPSTLGRSYPWSAASTLGADLVAEDGNVTSMPVSTSKAVHVAYSSRRLLSVEDSLVQLQLNSVFLPDDLADDVTPDVFHRVVVNPTA